MKRFIGRLYNFIKIRFFRSDKEYVIYSTAFFDALLQVYANPFMLRICAVEYENVGKVLNITVHTYRPGLVIGMQGKDIDKLQDILSRYLNCQVKVLIKEIRRTR